MAKMTAKRIIPCLDVKNGQVVKGVNFVGLREVGTPSEMALTYARAGADELVFLDITASVDNRSTQLEWVREVASLIDIPFTVGGGVSSVADAKALLRAGADKVAVNSAAVRRPELIRELADQFGQQCVVLAVDAKLIEGERVVYAQGGRLATELKLFEWVSTAEQLGAGEILYTSMDTDGVKSGYEMEGLRALREMTQLPIIASGGAGLLKHFVEVFQKTDCDGALAASVFHYNEISISDLKSALRQAGIETRTLYP